MAGFAAGQALTPSRDQESTVADAAGKVLQYFQQLQETGAAVQAHVFPYPFYLSRVLDLEFSVNTTLPEAFAGSRYKLAALAFDTHIAKLVRPVMANFKGDLDFDGIAFSTTIHQGDKADAAQASEVVEFFFPLTPCAAAKLMIAQDNS